MILLKDKLLVSLYTASIILSALSLFLIFSNFDLLNSDAYLITRYSSDRGINSFGTIFSVFGYWFFNILIITLNLGVSRILFYRKLWLSRIFAIVSILVSLLILIHIGVIISVN